MATALKVTIDDVDAIPEQSVIKVADFTLTRIFYRKDARGWEAAFGGQDLTGTAGMSLLLRQVSNDYSVYVQEV